MQALYNSVTVYPTYAIVRTIYDKKKSKGTCRANYDYINNAIRDKQNENLRCNSSKGMMSIKAQKRIKNAVNWLAMSVPRKRIFNKVTKKSFTFQLGLITLTLPSKQMHSDNEIKREVLQPFINYMRKAWLVHNYIWKAETQANGNIHFHIIIDEFIHMKAINSVWNKMLSRLDYVGGKASTRIESIKKVNDIGAYMAKYMSKNEEGRRLVNGKLWACSESLSEKSTKLTYDTNNVGEEFNSLIECATTKQKELIVYQRSDTAKERGFYVGELFLYKWQNLLHRAKAELRILVNKIREKICPPCNNIFIAYE